MIKFDKIKKIYKNSLCTYTALDGINVDIAKGEFAAIVGESGSGKSTFMNIAGTLDKPDEGNVYINNINTAKMNKNELCSFRNKTIGFVFQSFNLIESLSVEKNIELVLLYGGISSSKRSEMVKKALYEVGLSDKIKSFPCELSGGQKQRIAIARAIVNDPKIILADEPSGNLDPENSIKIMELFKDMVKKGKTVLVVTHDISKLNYVTRTISIQNGHLVS